MLKKNKKIWLWMDPAQYIQQSCTFHKIQNTRALENIVFQWTEGIVGLK